MIRILAGTAIVALSFVATLARADPVEIKFAYINGDDDVTYKSAMKPFIDAVNRDAQGTIRLVPYLNGALSRNFPQQSQIILDGIADIAFVLPALTPGRFPDNVIELPGLFQDTREATLVFSDLVTRDELRGYEKYFVIGAFGAVPSSLHTKPRISDADSFRGLKIRATSALEQKVIQGLGAASLILPISEAAEAVARGTIDGTALQPSPLVDFGIARLATYHYMIKLSVAPLAILMNKERFAALPKVAQDAIVRYSGAWISERSIEGLNGRTAEILKQWSADPKSKVIEPTPADLARFATISAEIRAAWAAQDPRHAKLLAEAEAILVDIRKHGER